MNAYFGWVPLEVEGPVTFSFSSSSHNPPKNLKEFNLTLALPFVRASGATGRIGFKIDF